LERIDAVKVEAVFLAGRDQPSLPKNASPTAGALAWTASLRQRVTAPMERLRALQGEQAAADGLLSAERSFEMLMTGIVAYEKDIMGTWCSRVADVSDAKLKQPLLRFVNAGHDGYDFSIEIIWLHSAMTCPFLYLMPLLYKAQNPRRGVVFCSGPKHRRTSLKRRVYVVAVALGPVAQHNTYHVLCDTTYMCDNVLPLMYYVPVPRCTICHVP
jgi:hypothetical protein